MAEPGSELRFLSSKDISTLQALQYFPLQYQNFNLAKTDQNGQLKTFLLHNVGMLEWEEWAGLDFSNLTSHLNPSF